MVKKTITYTDFNGVQRTEDFYFNYTQPELAKMEFGVDGGLSEMIEKATTNKDNKVLQDLFEKLILGAYGEKSEDGRRFIKRPEISEEFSQTAAYSVLWTELAQNADAATKFFNEVIPDTIKKQIAANNK